MIGFANEFPYSVSDVYVVQGEIIFVDAEGAARIVVASCRSGQGMGDCNGVRRVAGRVGRGAENLGPQNRRCSVENMGALEGESRTVVGPKRVIETCSEYVPNKELG